MLLLVLICATTSSFVESSEDSALVARCQAPPTCRIGVPCFVKPAGTDEAGSRLALAVAPTRRLDDRHSNPCDGPFLAQPTYLAAYTKNASNGSYLFCSTQ